MENFVAIDLETATSYRGSISSIVGNASERCKKEIQMQRSEALPTGQTPRFVDLHDHIQIRTDALPHWHQSAKTQFVTFRLFDSMPQERLAELEAFRNEWMNMHPLPWDDETKCKYDKEVRRKTEKWLDNGYGSCILRKPEVRKIVSDALLHYQGRRYFIHHFVIMPNHIHLLVTPLTDNTVNEDLGSVKRFAANAINKLMGTRGEVWQRLVFDHMVRSEESYNAFVKYIKENPKNLPDDAFTLFDAIVANASERCEKEIQMQRSEALPT